MSRSSKKTMVQNGSFQARGGVFVFSLKFRVGHEYFNLELLGLVLAASRELFFNTCLKIVTLTSCAVWCSHHHESVIVPVMHLEQAFSCWDNKHCAANKTAQPRSVCLPSGTKHTKYSWTGPEIATFLPATVQMIHAGGQERLSEVIS